MSVEAPEGLKKQFRWAESYIPSSYIKFLEMAGARVVPVLINRAEDYYSYLFNAINGLLLPGGGVSLQDPNSWYYKSATSLFKSAVKANDNSDYFAIWGTCLGFEMLSILLANQTNWLTSCSCQDVAYPLVLSADFEKSRMFQNIPSDNFITDLKTKPVTANFHKQCLTPENVTASGLDKAIHILSTNKDVNGLNFVSTYEAYKYPFYGVQWHPEKNNFEWKTQSKSIPHTQEAIFTSQFFANMFVGETRKNSHKFYNDEAEDKSLINRYHSYFTDASNTSFTEVYLFHNNDMNW
uniref:folate gamma-glutamyl hydrolase n=1 Tax=Strigamia maritima TaxID=126957 RepID=T1JIA3_STRMM